MLHTAMAEWKLTTTVPFSINHPFEVLTVVCSWLSKTSDVPSIGWDANQRILSMGQIQE